MKKFFEGDDIIIYAIYAGEELNIKKLMWLLCNRSLTY